jgi:hypothetical protein
VATGPKQIIPVRRGMSIGDGFKFGCGMILANVVFTLILAIVLIGAFLAAQSAGLIPNLSGLLTPPA